MTRRQASIIDPSYGENGQKKNSFFFSNTVAAVMAADLFDQHFIYVSHKTWDETTMGE